MPIELTDTQKQRLIELDAEDGLIHRTFSTNEARDSYFRKHSKTLEEKNRERLERLEMETRRPAVRQIESILTQELNEQGFTEVVTPTILSKGMLKKMGIGEDHSLFKQIFWLDKKTCLRPMLAPNLYYLMGRLSKNWTLPLRIFEIGQCFRKESKGSRHISEFTMLNLVEMGTEGDPQKRMEELISVIMDSLDLGYRIEKESSEVYGTTTDVIVKGMEVASCATGPHPLDINWEIAESWVGLGFGLERLVMAREGFTNIRRAGRSLIYLDGARLNI